ncbi:MAG: hypothetical protein KatS3mg117_1028 [Geminicoccaceae bacterium]|jgi:seryl-tRNA synthetase|nr:MAG: hypothetical protein KatS3mg117_1028 [Geminicoccaceae bacterium]
MTAPVDGLGPPVGAEAPPPSGLSPDGREGSAGTAPTVGPASDFLRDLTEAGLLLETGVPGLYGRSARFEALIERIDEFVSRRTAEDGAERLRFPPALPRRELERSGYLEGFPHLAGTVHAFTGDERAHRALLADLEAGRDWTTRQRPTDVALLPAACYPVYPTLAARGPLPERGALVDVASWCFRHEPSREPTRLQFFRMREQVRIGEPEAVRAFRDDWLERGRRLIDELALPCTITTAHDPFFGRGGRMMAASQKEQGLKFELLVPILDGGGPTACLSFNWHRDRFGRTFGLRTARGEPAHSACVGIGLERLALALLRHHGLEPERWPRAVRALLGS